MLHVIRTYVSTKKKDKYTTVKKLLECGLIIISLHKSDTHVKPSNMLNLNKIIQQTFSCDQLIRFMILKCSIPTQSALKMNKRYDYQMY